ncbi:MAG: Mrp/NBP35 family ATP-binding protein [Desulfurococcaceae archaeon]
MNSREKKVRFTPPFTLINRAREKLSAYKYRILVMSGKGGVGKSFVSSMLALGLALKNRKVALLDADIHGSSIPILLGLQGKRHYANEEGEILPVEGPWGLKVVAVNLMLDSPDTPLAWRGPLIAKAIIELAAKAVWGTGDYLIVDMPPGTGDAPLTAVQVLSPITGMVLVTSPNTLSETIVAKAANFAVSTGIRLLGIVENMSYFKCPHCGKVTSIMGTMVGERLAAKYGTALLGKIPLDPGVNEAVDKGMPYLLTNANDGVSKAIMEIVNRVISIVENSGN